jgi:hypothetical protein
MQSVYLSAKWLHHFSKCSEKCFTASLLHRFITDRYHFRASSLIVITSSLHHFTASSKLNSPEMASWRLENYSSLFSEFTKSATGLAGHAMRKGKSKTGPCTFRSNGFITFPNVVKMFHRFTASSLHNWSLSLQGFITDRYHFITSSLHRVIKIEQPRNGFMAFGKL